MNMWMIISFLIIGFLIGYFEVLPSRFYDLTDHITNIGLIFLLASMGAKIGVNEKILNQIDKIGLQALTISIGSIIGSIIILKISLKIIDIEFSKDEKIEEKGEVNRSMTIMIIASVILGILLGITIIPKSLFPYIDPVTTYALAILLLGIGIDIGLNKETLIKAKRLGLTIILIPIAIAIGSIIGAITSGYIVGLIYNQSAAVGAGFGWYSLSGVILAEIHSVELGSIAFLSNVLRELISILTIPLIAKYSGKIICIAPGGATTMDVTLPIIKESAGEEIVIPAFISGVTLSTLVPLLVPFLINL